jgi:hypothetical protein
MRAVAVALLLGLLPHIVRSWQLQPKLLTRARVLKATSLKLGVLPAAEPVTPPSLPSPVTPIPKSCIQLREPENGCDVFILGCLHVSLYALPASRVASFIAGITSGWAAYHIVLFTVGVCSTAIPASRLPRSCQRLLVRQSRCSPHF